MNLVEFQNNARELMDNHGLYDWIFKFDNALRRVGCCFYREKKLSFSKHFVLQENWETIKDTVLHEIAHALVGPGHGHNYYWKMKARHIGAKPERCASLKLEKPKTWILDCKCETKAGFYRASYKQFKCRRCGYVGYMTRNNDVSISR